MVSSCSSSNGSGSFLESVELKSSQIYTLLVREYDSWSTKDRQGRARARRGVLTAQKVL